MLAMARSSGVRLLNVCWRPSTVLSVALALGVGQLVAGPLVKQVRPAIGSPKPLDNRGATAESTPFAELSKALAESHAKLEELERILGTVTVLHEELATVRDQNRLLTAEVQAARAAHQRSDEITQTQIAELGHALDEAEARDKRRAHELAEVRKANAALTADLTRLSTQRDEAQAEAEHVRADLIARIDQLVADAESSAAKARRLEEELSDAQEIIAIATDARNEAEAGAVDLRMALDGMSSEAALQREQLAAMAEQLNSTEGALVFLEQERKDLLDQLRGRRAEADRLEGQLATARQELAEREAANSGLQERLATFETAAARATDAAIQTLHAVEAQLASLSSVLSTGELAQGSMKVVTASTAQGGKAMPTSSDPPNHPIPEANLRNPAPAAGPDQATTSRFAMLMMPGRAMMPMAEITANLPIESQIQAQNLLVDLEAQPDSEGIKMVVPGMELFASNSDAVQGDAHARLAQVAELLQLYQRQQVLVLGHTDAVGDQGNNMKLSERRAEAVKQFFINHFGIEASRLSSRGMGENQPIASNATASGREANRRVEVLILN